jgi:calcineurin-like phosphoesterase family protein
MRIVKKTNCVLLSVILSLSCLITAAAQENKNLDVFVISDTHYEAAALLNASPEDDLEKDEVYRNVNAQGKLSYESEAILRSMLQTFVESDTDIMLIPGDICDTDRQDYRLEIAKIFKQVEATGKKIYLINGNHDISKFDSTIEFKEAFADFGYNEALCVDANSCSYTVELDDNYRLIAVDSCVYGEDGGKINNNVLQWVEQQAIQAKHDGKKLIGIMHHAIIPHFFGESLLEGTILIDNYSKISEKFTNWGIKFVFTGHFHGNDISQSMLNNGNKIYDIMTGSLITYPNPYRKITFFNDKVTINTKYVNHIDTAYLPVGFTDAQLNAINHDFVAYSKGFFEAGMSRWINSYLGTPRKLADLLNLSKEDTAYKLLERFMPYIGNALTMPIYEDNPNSSSLEKIANYAGVEFPDSEYTSVSMLISKILGSQFAGDENIKADSVEVTLLLDCMRSCIASAFSGILCDILYKNGLGSIFDFFGLNIREIFEASIAEKIFKSSALEIEINRLIAPIINGFTSDYYEPSDLNVELESY